MHGFIAVAMCELKRDGGSVCVQHFHNSSEVTIWVL